MYYTLIRVEALRFTRSRGHVVSLLLFRLPRRVIIKGTRLRRTKELQKGGVYAVCTASKSSTRPLLFLSDLGISPPHKPPDSISLYDFYIRYEVTPFSVA